MMLFLEISKEKIAICYSLIQNCCAMHKICSQDRKLVICQTEHRMWFLGNYEGNTVIIEFLFIA